MFCRHLSILVALALAGVSQISIAQGPLTPPGAPAPTMKSLDEIYEAVTTVSPDSTRIAIRNVDLPMTIDQPGSYYLVEPIDFDGTTHAISITASDVTIDLNGYTMTGPGKVNSAVTSRAVNMVDGPSRVTIRNGAIIDWPTGGISWINTAPVNCTASDLIIQDVGGNVGLALGLSSVVEDCRISNASGNGISTNDGSVVRRCTVENSGSSTTNIGIAMTNDCVGEDLVSRDNVGYGFRSILQGRFENCVALRNGATGFYSTQGTDVVYRYCEATENSGSGFHIGDRAVVDSCVANRNGIHGIEAVGANPSNMMIVNTACHSNTDHGLSAATSFRGSVTNSRFFQNGRDGIRGGANWHVEGNQCTSNGGGSGITDGAGIRMENSAVVRKNTVLFNDIGITATFGSGYYAQNAMSGNTTQINVLGAATGSGDMANVTF